MAAFTAILDACVLYPFHLRDLLMHLSRTELFRARWTDRIHDEWIRNVVANGGNPAKLARTRQLMDAAVPDCLVSGYEPLIPTLELPDPDDRHVLAAAVHAGASVIVTANLRDFPALRLQRHGVEARHPDEFAASLFELDEAAVLTAVKRQRANLKRPPMSVDAFLETLERAQLPMTVERLRAFSDLL